MSGLDELRALAVAVDMSEPWYAAQIEIRTKNPEEICFIAAANPTAVIELLDRLAAAEAAVERVRVIATDLAFGDSIDNRIAAELTAAIDQPPAQEVPC